MNQGAGRENKKPKDPANNKDNGEQIEEAVHILCLLQEGNHRTKYDHPMACFRSSMRSVTSSIPTLSLIRESVRPFFIRSSLGMEAWVMDAG